MAVLRVSFDDLSETADILRGARNEIEIALLRAQRAVRALEVNGFKGESSGAFNQAFGDVEGMGQRVLVNLDFLAGWLVSAAGSYAESDAQSARGLGHQGDPGDNDLGGAAGR